MPASYNSSSNVSSADLSCTDITCRARQASGTNRTDGHDPCCSPGCRGDELFRRETDWDDAVRRTSGREKPRQIVFIGGKTDQAGEDGFQISCHNGTMRILSGGDKGAILGVAHLLERYCGINYLGKDAWTVNHVQGYKVREGGRPTVARHRMGGDSGLPLQTVGKL